MQLVGAGLQLAVVFGCDNGDRLAVDLRFGAPGHIAVGRRFALGYAVQFDQTLIGQVQPG